MLRRKEILWGPLLIAGAYKIALCGVAVPHASMIWKHLLNIFYSPIDFPAKIYDPGIGVDKARNRRN